MADFTIPALLAHKPEEAPPRRLRLLFLPAIIAILGMVIALAAATSGQDERRNRDQLKINYDLAYWSNELGQARATGKPDDELAKIQSELNKAKGENLPSYDRYGRQFTSWDGYRYEEIVERGYAYHQPDASQSEKDDSKIELDGPEMRLKNVVWYPLYPVIGWLVSRGVGISANHALTAVSWVSCLLAAVVMFLYARRHYFNRMPVLDLTSEEVKASESHPARRWDLSPQDTAALWVVAACLFGPCSIFLYANFTESLFLLLLVCFLYCVQSRWWWRAALVAAVASASRSQGVLFGPLLALSYLLRSNKGPGQKIGIAVLLGLVSAIGIGCYMVYLQHQFHDAFAFMHAQKYWNVGLNWDRIRYAANPMHAMQQVFSYAFFRGEVDWPRLWEAFCLIWPPVVLLVFGGRYLSFELEVVGWMLWALPYISNCKAGNPPMDSQWMSMGRFMAVLVPAYIIAGAVFVRFRWLGLMFILASASAFAVFALKFGDGSWVG